jgi:hypothetical protein
LPSPKLRRGQARLAGNSIGFSTVKRRPWRGEKGFWDLPAWNEPGQEVAKDARYEESRQRLLVHVAAKGFGCITRLASCLAIDFPRVAGDLAAPIFES